jgi:RsiW-degrading membrane proteinase PrsW (M82 family)
MASLPTAYSAGGFSDPQTPLAGSPVAYVYQDTTTQASPSEPGWIVWGCGSICCATIIVLMLIGILMHAPWLGVFALVSLLPGLFIAWLIYWRNHRDEAILNRVVKFVAIGMLGVVPLIVVELLMMKAFEFFELVVQNGIAPLFNVFVMSFFEAFLVASLCEESFKFLVARFVSVMPGRDFPYSVVIYSAAGALGLASLENMMYIVSASARDPIGGLFTAVTRALLAVPLHTTTGVLIGVDMAFKKFRGEDRNYFRVLLVPFLLHGIYDFGTMFPSFYVALVAENYWIFLMFPISIGALIVGIWYARRRVRELLSMRNLYLPTNFV